MNKTANNERIYEILDQIGRGSYASVYKAINKKTGELCAIKKIPVESQLTNVKNEIDILSDCECKNIVRFLDSACIGGGLSISMEYCRGGSVKDVMKSLNCTITEKQIIIIVKDVLNGLDYLHSKNKTHRDVKAANILLDGEGNAKLADFGVSEPSDTPSQKQSLIGTLLWLPPEVINKDCSYKPVIDIWSLGITMIEMAEGDPPYYDLDQKAALHEIANLNKPPPRFKESSKWCPKLNELLALCLVKDASKRKTARELLNCDIIKECQSNQVIKELVDKVCAFRLSSEKNLSKKSRYLRMEFQILDNIYEERKMKLSKQDSLIKKSEELQRTFIESLARNKERERIVRKAEIELKKLIYESEQLERRRNELSRVSEDLKRRNDELLNEVKIINMRLKSAEAEEEIRRRKLNSLES